VTAGDRIQAELDDQWLVAQAMCAAAEATGAAPCSCGADRTRCAALDVYGDQARETVAALLRAGRIVSHAAAIMRAPISLSPGKFGGGA